MLNNRLTSLKDEISEAAAKSLASDKPKKTKKPIKVGKKTIKRKRK